MKTILVTGSSSGIGKATVKLFQSKGWQVIASMRHPEKEDELSKLAHVDCVTLDVTKLDEIAATINTLIKKYGAIDVIVNNAGYGLIGAFECATVEQISTQINTNVTGLMAITKAVLPHMRKDKSGTIVNISSVAGKVSFPFYSCYNATKWAVEGLSEALQYELSPFNIKVKLVEPGLVETNFFGPSLKTSDMSSVVEYAELYQYAEKHMGAGKGIKPEQVAAVIYQASTDQKTKLRYPVGNDAKLMIKARKILGENILQWLIKKVLIKNK